MQPKQPGGALSADSFSAALRKLSSGRLVLFLDLGESSFQEKGGLWGVDELELGAHGREEGSLQRQGEAGMLVSAQLYRPEAPPAENLLDGLASKNSSHGKTGAGQRLGRWGTKELERAW